MCDAPEYPKPRDLLAPEEARIPPTQDQAQRIEAVRAKLVELELTESDIADAVDSARRAK